MIASLLSWWRARQRATDLAILWPICVQQAPTLDHARAAFAVHAFNDPAWLEYGDRLPDVIGGLTAARTASIAEK